MNITIIIIVLIVIFILFIAMTGYVKAPPDQAFIISGLRKKIVIGKAGIKIPFLERVDKLSLKMMSVDVKTGTFVPTKEYINVKVDGAVKIKIGTEANLIKLASENFLNRKDEYIIEQVKDVLEGNMREIIGQMTLQEMVQNRKSFGEKVQENAVPDLLKMGLEIISFNVQSFDDENNIIVDLGIDNVAQIKKDAAIAKAQAERDIKIAQADASKKSNDAEVEADRQIAEKQNELAIKRAYLKIEADTKNAEADIAYDIQKQEKRKIQEQKTAEANIIKEENEIIIQQKKLEATIKEQAEAELFRLKKQAEADLYRRQKEAEGIREVGYAEAEAIKAKAIAEAEGIDKKAEAMKKYGEAAIFEMYFQSLPEIAKNIAEPLSKVDKITMYGEGNSVKLVKDIVNTMSQVTDGVKESTGLDLKSVIAGMAGLKLFDNKNTIVATANEKNNSVNSVVEPKKVVEDSEPDEPTEKPTGPGRNKRK